MFAKKKTTFNNWQDKKGKKNRKVSPKTIASNSSFIIFRETSVFQNVNAPDAQMVYCAISSWKKLYTPVIHNAIIAYFAS